MPISTSRVVGSAKKGSLTQSARTIDFASPLRIVASECCVSSVGSYSRLNCNLICTVCGPRNFCNRTEQDIHHSKRIRVVWEVNRRTRKPALCNVRFHSSTGINGDVGRPSPGLSSSRRNRPKFLVVAFSRRLLLLKRQVSYQYNCESNRLHGLEGHSASVCWHVL